MIFFKKYIIISLRLGFAAQVSFFETQLSSDQVKVAFKFNKMTFKKFGKRNFPRKMFKGNWKCADCGKEITELPFEPSGDRAVYCKDCWLKRKK